MVPILYFSTGITGVFGMEKAKDSKGKSKSFSPNESGRSRQMSMVVNRGKEMIHSKTLNIQTTWFRRSV